MRILIAGTGAIADEFEKYISGGVKVVGYVETKPQRAERNGKRIYSYKEISDVSYDKVVVANIYSDEIKATVKELNLNLDDFIFIRPWTELDCECGNFLFHWDELKLIAPEYYDEKLHRHNRYFIANRMFKDDIEDSAVRQSKVWQRDYFRYRTFELVAEQVKELEGAVAEVGVFQGEFAKLINTSFPQKKLYLFDTFESFDSKEYEEERQKGNCEDGFDKFFTYTNVKRVLNRMPYPEMCIVKKGLFPMTAEGIDEKFVFVSIDVDFEASIYESMCWFYPRMTKGGIIFIHDYNNKILFGVKKAIQKFEEEKEIKLNKLPIADWGGTLAVIK